MTAGVTRKSLDKIHDTVEYYPHQLEGIRTMARMTSFLCADEMGLGKSLQALTVAAIDFQRGWAKRVLIVAPVSLKWNWEEEIGRHTNFTCTVLNGTPNERASQLQSFDRGNVDILIVNYEQVTSHIKDLNRLSFDIAIYDEAHYIKNNRSKRTKAALRVQAGRHILLTGTPLLNQVDELWPLLHRIDPKEYPDFWRFINRYAVKGGYQDKQIVGVKNRAELNTKLQSVMVRRLARDVLSLEEPQITPVYVDLTDRQREVYKQAFEEMKIDIPGNPTPMECENALTKYLRLKQICGTLACIEGFDDESAKLDEAVLRTIELLYNGHHVIVFTQFREVQRCFAERLESLKGAPPVYQLNGSVPQEDRIPIVNAWAANDKPSVMVGMLQVVKEGYNMTKASKIIFLDKLYVPKLNEQAIGRANRIGQTEPVQVFEIIARKTVEQRIETILRSKTKLFNSLVEESNWKQALVQALMEDDDEDD